MAARIERAPPICSLVFQRSSASARSAAFSWMHCKTHLFGDRASFFVTAREKHGRGALLNSGLMATRVSEPVPGVTRVESARYGVQFLAEKCRFRLARRAPGKVAFHGRRARGEGKANESVPAGRRKGKSRGKNGIVSLSAVAVRGFTRP